MKRNGWKKLKDIISNYALDKASPLDEGELITPLFAFKPTNPVSMDKPYSDVLLSGGLPSEKFVFLVCAIKKKILYMPRYPSTQYYLMTRQKKTGSSKKRTSIASWNTRPPRSGCLT